MGGRGYPAGSKQAADCSRPRRIICCATVWNWSATAFKYLAIVCSKRLFHSSGWREPRRYHQQQQHGGAKLMYRIASRDSSISEQRFINLKG